MARGEFISELEETIIKMLYSGGCNQSEIARFIGRTQPAIHGYLVRAKSEGKLDFFPESYVGDHLSKAAKLLDSKNAVFDEKLKAEYEKSGLLLKKRFEKYLKTQFAKMDLSVDELKKAIAESENLLKSQLEERRKLFRTQFVEGERQLNAQKAALRALRRTVTRTISKEDLL